jgi:cytochrome P450
MNGSIQMSERPPVMDWLTDWDHLDRRWVDDPYPIWDEIRSAKCPIAHTDRFRGAYLPTRYADIREIAYDPEHFSSRQVVVRDSQPVTGGGAPPITSDPPRHRTARMVLLPPFTPQAIEKLRPKTRAICNELIDAFAGRSGCDAAVDYAQHIPVRVIAAMLGIPESDGDRFRKWINEILELGTTDDTTLQRGLNEITEYLAGHMEARRKAPGDDLISYLLQARYPDGEPFKPNHVLGSLRLLLVAGIDTTWSGIGASIWHLARTPADRERLTREPELIPTAIEEFLRAFAPVTMARLVAKETTVNGCTFAEGEMVMLSFPAANRDPAVFPDANKVIIDRQENRHAAFGLGIHRCVGSNLARMEMTVAIEELLRRCPSFHLTGEVAWSHGTVRGPRLLPIAFP